MQSIQGNRLHELLKRKGRVIELGQQEIGLKFGENHIKRPPFLQFAGKHQLQLGQTSPHRFPQSCWAVLV
ncbi:Uncharacterised protein [Burkholderia pseudomallei]|nr:Uncharacterised protein [Burkholderia pseudomallei]CAJ5100787.1 Uncharacterised protein [Burkholderia pseudomallei]CAJ8316730.1 Uncharacterised protein [Burkholderia pseudomallei]CAJ8455102.1 Uncharacterised protein [Burkholderia pseudomallei]CAJ8566045.1 Uncharacterised protein [Burkholderia pseudomallei]